MRIELKTRNASAIAANFVARDRRAQSRIRRAVADANRLEYRIAQALCPVDKGFMREHMRNEMFPSGLGYEIGWIALDFAAAGLPFYPPYQEFGTYKMPAQPSITPARAAVRPEFSKRLRQEIRAANRERGAS